MTKPDILILIVQGEVAANSIVFRSSFEDKAKIFAGNLGRLLGIDTTKRRIK